MHSSSTPAQPTLAERELTIARLASLVRHARFNAGATAGNAALLTVLLFDTAPKDALAFWATLQLAGAAWFFRKAGRVPGKPRGSARGVRRAVTVATLAGVSLGSAILLLHAATELQKFVVFLTFAAMASGASTTLASVPQAARGYVLGVLLPPTIYWCAQWRLDYLVLAGLSVSLILYLLNNSSNVHELFLQSYRQVRKTAEVRDRFRLDMEEWLDLSHATEAFALLDGEGRLLLYNARFTELVQPARPERGSSYLALLKQASVPCRVNGESVTRKTWRSIRKQQRQYPVELLEEYEQGSIYRVTVHRLPSGREAILAVDVTDLQRVEQTAREAELAAARSQQLETVGTMAGGVAHDFNNLLTTIGGAATLLENQPDSYRERELLSDIRQAVTRGATLTRQLLAYGRRQHLAVQDFDLNPVILRVASLVKSLAGASIEVRTECYQDVSMVRADPAGIEQVLLNLALNSKDAMPEGGKLCIATRDVDESFVEVRVTDSGQGMDEATMARMFEPFFSTKERHLGSGLGLAVVHGTVRQSGGKLTVQSAPGQGTDVTFTLPRSRKRAPIAATVYPRVAKVLPIGAVLLVDDEPSIRRLGARMVELLGYSVHTAADAGAALSFLRSGRPSVDVLLTDVVMPNVGGVELAREAVAVCPSLRVIFMTGYDAGTLRGVEGQVVIQKPFDQSALHAAFERVMGSHEGLPA